MRLYDKGTIGWHMDYVKSIYNNWDTHYAKTLLRRFDLNDSHIIKGLSHGQRVKAALLLILARRPKLLILDEPTAGVDIEVRRSMWDFLRELNKQGITIILTTHYLEEAEMLCRNIAIINGGEIVENTTMKALLAQLDVETFVFDLSPHEKGLSLTDTVYRVIDDHTLEVDINKSQSLNHVFTQLTEQNINVLSMRNKSNRLEALFVNLISTKEPSKEVN